MTVSTSDDDARSSSALCLLILTSSSDNEDMLCNQFASSSNQNHKTSNCLSLTSNTHAVDFYDKTNLQA